LATNDVTAEGAQPGPRLRPPRRRFGEDGVKLFFAVCAVISIATTVGIVLSLLQPAIEFFTEINFVDFITGTRWAPLFEPPDFGVVPLLTGTFSITVWASLVCIPFGLGAAIYMSEYAHPRVRKAIKPILEILAGIPSVVLGFFAISVINPAVIQRFWPNAQYFNLAAAGIGVGVLTVPLVASVAEDAMRAVPHSLREAAYGLGGKKLTTTLRVVVPAAVSGIVVALILGISRAIGETMVVAVAGGGTGGSLREFDPLHGGQTMTAAMAALGAGTDQVAGSGEAFQSLFFVGLLLFALTLALNLASDRIVRRFRETY
jgi:phosphate transport system permease protein